MSCPNATAPIDINMQNITGTCDYKCSYSFNYSNSSCVVTNRGNYLSISYDQTNTSPVQYNAQNYYVQEIRLYVPSLHSYNNSRVDCECMIVHNSNTSAKQLLVCLPVNTGDESASLYSTKLFKSIVTTASNTAPTEDTTANVDINDFNLNKLVPKKPFFSYTATEPYQPCSSEMDYIVFDKQNALTIDSDTLTILENIISNNPYDIKSGPKLFYNEQGPNRTDLNGGDIFIDCQPVGSSETTTDIVSEKSTKPITFTDIMKSPAIQIILGALLFIVLLFLVKTGLSIFKPAKGEYGLNLDMLKRG